MSQRLLKLSAKTILTSSLTSLLLIASVALPHESQAVGTSDSSNAKPSKQRKSPKIFSVHTFNLSGYEFKQFGNKVLALRNYTDNWGGIIGYEYYELRLDGTSYRSGVLQPRDIDGAFVAYKSKIIYITTGVTQIPAKGVVPATCRRYLLAQSLTGGTVFKIRIPTQHGDTYGLTCNYDFKLSASEDNNFIALSWVTSPWDTDEVRKLNSYLLDLKKRKVVSTKTSKNFLEADWICNKLFLHNGDSHRLMDPETFKTIQISGTAEELVLSHATAGPPNCEIFGRLTKFFLGNYIYLVNSDSMQISRKFGPYDVEPGFVLEQHSKVMLIKGYSSIKAYKFPSDEVLWEYRNPSNKYIAMVAASKGQVTIDTNGQFANLDITTGRQRAYARKPFYEYSYSVFGKYAWGEKGTMRILE